MHGDMYQGSSFFCHFTNRPKSAIIFVEQNNMKFHVLPLRRELRGKQVGILRGAAAVWDEYRLTCHCSHKTMGRQTI